MRLIAHSASKWAPKRAKLGGTMSLDVYAVVVQLRTSIISETKFLISKLVSRHFLAQSWANAVADILIK